MRYILAYKVKIKNRAVNKTLDATLDIYREALSFCVEIFDREFDGWHDLDGKERNNYLESLIHSTKFNKAKYPEFDKQFYKFPSYLRRDVIASAMGKVNSYHTNLENDDRHNLGVKHREFPNFYKGQQFIRDLEEGKEIYKIKVFKDNTWNWISVNLRKTDLDYLKKHIYNHPDLKQHMSPKLIKKGRSFYLQFSFQFSTPLCNTKLNNQRIIAVDLGINSSAVCSAMTADGTVYDRYFSNQSKEKDRLYHMLNILRKKQKQGGRHAKNKKLWTQINDLNKHIAEETARDIVDFALKNGSDVIVMEHLSNMKPKGSRKQRLHMWKKRFVFNIVMSQAHKHGIRVRTINPSCTSKHAYDGSGTVVRNKENYAICTFQNGKVYNTDLNGSYNIGARYFIKEFKKTMSEKIWSQLEAKVPSLGQRIQGTLSSLISLDAELKQLAA